MMRMATEMSIRAAVCTAALFVWQTGGASADFSARGVLGYLTGLSMSGDSSNVYLTAIERPAAFAADPGSYIELSGNRQEALRTVSGSEKNIGHGIGSFGLKHMIPGDRAGFCLSYSERSSTLAWPFSKDSVHLKEFHYSGDLLFTGFAALGTGITAGITTGKSVRGGDGWIHSAQVSGSLPRGIRVMLRLYSIPCDWGIDADFEGETRTLFSEFRRKGAEGSVAVSLFNTAELRLAGGRGTIDTPGSFRGVPYSHTQEWNADTGNWRTDVSATIASRIAVLLSYGRETIPGELGLWYNGSRYMRGKCDIGTHRFRLEVRGKEVSRAVPAVRFDRVSTDFDISHGVVDSWPFTPGQMEIIGDKTWTFSGTGRFVSDSVTSTWDTVAGSRFSASLLRVYPDYLILITTRDHLSTEPWDMLFGRRRAETDRTRYYDFASVAYRKEFTLRRFAVTAGIQQLIPLRHAERKIPGKAPAPPSFPKLRFARPKRYGGLEVWAGVKYFLR